MGAMLPLVVLTAVLQISTVLAAVLTLVWHQTRTVDRLRDEVRSDHGHLLKLHAKATRQAHKDNNRLREEFTAANNGLREELTAANNGLREEFTTAHGRLWDLYGKLWDTVIENGRKLDRIGGFLGIGMPEPAAGQAPGAAFTSLPSERQLRESQPQEPQPGAPQSGTAEDE